MLHGESVQRLSSHIARLTPHARAIIAEAMAKVREQFPTAGVLFPIATPEQYFRAVESLATVAKCVPDLGALQPWLRNVGAWCAANNLNPAAAQVAQSAFMSAVRTYAGADWSKDLDNDWYAMLKVVFGFMAEGAGASNSDAGADKTAYFVQPKAQNAVRAAA